MCIEYTFQCGCALYPLVCECAFYAHSHVSVLYMQIICTCLYDCAKEARMVIIISLPTPIPVQTNCNTE